MRMPTENEYADRILRLLLQSDGSRQSCRAAIRDWRWDRLLALTKKNLVLIRSYSRLREEDILPDKAFEEAVTKEEEHVRHMVELIGTLGDLCLQNKVQFIFIKAFQHYPDMGHDIDLFVLDRSKRVDSMISEALGAYPAEGSALHRLSGKMTYNIDGHLSPIEIHHGRMGHIGEEARYGKILMRNRINVSIGGVATFIPRPEDQLILQVLETVYNHFSIRLSDVIYAIKVVSAHPLNWDYIVKTANQIGISNGLSCYLSYVNQIYHSIYQRPLFSEKPVKELLSDCWGRTRFRDWYYRFPKGSVIARLYLKRLLAKSFSDRHIELLVKPFVDMALSLMLLTLISLFLAVIAILIKTEDGGPVFYLGLRVGKDGRPFRMFKFRTMAVDAERLGGPSTPVDDPRITKVGRFLRRYKLDELPQLINVLRGEMSLVGPRPEVPQEVETYSEEEKRVLSVKPGITDWASIKFHDEGEIIRESPDPHQAYREKVRPEKLKLALRYVDNHSLGIDLEIMIKTLIALFSKEGNHERDRQG